jgi:RNA polymerase sigma factor (sigma-70 family)
MLGANGNGNGHGSAQFSSSALEEIERRATIAKLVATLPEDQRLVITRRFLEHRSTREIAQEMRRTEGAVKQLQFRALENLRARIRSNRNV